ncbi:MAG: hypothetical protein IKD11_00295, partial [Oscillospiraceae bacterium]|nr:hypothetical protein [Oscillospiraceae bacterium]
TNTAYLVVDGTEVGALTTYYKAGSNQNKSVNWINGRTLTFNHMGKTANSHYLSMDLDYLQIWANGEPTAAPNWSVKNSVLDVTLSESAKMLVSSVAFARYEESGRMLSCTDAVPENGAASFARGTGEGKLFFLGRNGAPVLSAIQLP